MWPCQIVVVVILVKCNLANNACILQIKLFLGFQQSLRKVIFCNSILEIIDRDHVHQCLENLVHLAKLANFANLFDK